MLIFNVPQHIPRIKQTFEASENSIFTQTILDQFRAPSIYLFSSIFKIFCNKYSILTYFGSFYCLLFYYLQKNTKNNLDGDGKQDIHMNRYDQFLIITIIDPFGVGLSETLLLKVSFLVMLLLERIFLFHPKILWHSGIRYTQNLIL